MGQTTRVQLSGLTCSACERVISKRLKTIDDVETVLVQVSTGVTTISASRPITKDEIVKALQNTHYKVISIG